MKWNNFVASKAQTPIQNKAPEKTPGKVVKKVLKVQGKTLQKSKSSITGEKKSVKGKTDGIAVRQVAVKPNTKSEQSNSSKVCIFVYFPKL